MNDYDTWKTASPPEHRMVCPRCNRDAEDADELEVVGLESCGLMSYPLYILDPELTTGRRYIGGNRTYALQHTHFTTLWVCDCGAIVSDEGWVTEKEYRYA